MTRGRPKKETESVKKIPCISCGKEKLLTDFYLSNSEFHKNNQGRYPTCKLCLKKDLDETRLDSVKDLLVQLNRPFLPDLWNSAVEEAKNSNKEVFGLYWKILLLNNKHLTWKDNYSESNEILVSNKPNTEHSDVGLSVEELKEKYGYGYPDDEYVLFEKKYQQLRSSFQLLTTMHEEYFREYCINKVKETLAKSKGLFKEAKEWAAMVKDVAEAGKLKPSQMSKADLSGGLDTFGQLARMVEENREIQPLLPRFTEQPKDKVDIVLWCFVNYVRDLKGLPSCEYREIYDFYNRRKLEYETQMTDNEFSSNDGNDDVDE